MPVGMLPPGPKGRLVGNEKLNDPVASVGMGNEKPGMLGSVGTGRVESVSSLGTATGIAETIAMAERATMRKERMFAGGMGVSLVTNEGG